MIHISHAGEPKSRSRVCVCFHMKRLTCPYNLARHTRHDVGRPPTKTKQGGGAGQIKWSLIPWTLWPLQTFVYVAVLCCLICVTMDWSVVYRRHRRRGCCFDGKGKGCSFLLDWLMDLLPAWKVDCVTSGFPAVVLFGLGGGIKWPLGKAWPGWFVPARWQAHRHTCIFLANYFNYFLMLVLRKTRTTCVAIDMGREIWYTWRKNDTSSYIFFYQIFVKF